MRGVLVRTIRGYGHTALLDLSGSAPGIHACRVFDTEGRARSVRLLHER